MAVDELLRSSRLSWFGTEGADSDVVISSRVRLARNLVSLPFPGRANPCGTWGGAWAAV